MSTRNDHPHDELHLLLDGRLDAGARARVEAHVQTCPSCRRDLDVLKWTKQVARDAARAADAQVPPAMAERVIAALDRVDRAASEQPAQRARRWFAVPAAGLVLAAVIAFALMMGRQRAFDPVTAASNDLASHAASELELDLATESPQELEEFMAGRIGFPTRVFDFGMMNFTLRGGRVHEIDGRRSALFAYASAAGGHMVCQMYEGGLSELPDGFTLSELDGIEFRVYRRGAFTLVFWQEGPLVCVLASDGDPDEALQFARAKAKAAAI